MMIVMKEGATEAEVAAVVKRVESVGAQAHISAGELVTVIGAIGDRDEDEVVDGLAKLGVIVRAGRALGQEGWMRVTYGTRNENDRFLTALDQLS